MKNIILAPNPYRDKNFQTVRNAVEVLKGVGLNPRVCLPFDIDRSYELPKDWDYQFPEPVVGQFYDAGKWGPDFGFDGRELETGGFFVPYMNEYYSDNFIDEKISEYMDLINLKKELVALGVTFPDHKELHKQYDNLDAETKAKLKEIKQQVKEGKLTKEQAFEKMKEFGITFPHKEDHMNKIFDELDAEKRKKAEVLVANATAQLEKLGVKFHFGLLMHMKILEVF